MSPYGITRPQYVNSLAPRRSDINYKNIIFKIIVWTGIQSTSSEIALKWMLGNLIDNKS